ncbi:MAG: hypothetical protein WCR95_02780 [Eubacteriales bacterium]
MIRLFELNAFDISSAVTLEQTGVKQGFLLKRFLSPGTGFSAIVKNDSGRYYIPEENMEKAENKYKDTGASSLFVLGALVVFAIATLIITMLFPGLLSMIKDIFN